MITIGDTFFPLLPIPFDSKLCNFYYSGSNIVIETLAQYKTRVSINYRLPGVIITILSPKTGYTLQDSYPLDSFGSILTNFDFKYYTYKDGVADENFIELLLADASLYVLKSELKEYIFSIKLPAYASVALRCSNTISGTDYPAGWNISAGTSEYDLKITHGLNRNLVEVKVWEINADTTQRALPDYSAAYTGKLQLSKNEILIEGLTQDLLPLRIDLIFE